MQQQQNCASSCMHIFDLLRKAENPAQGRLLNINRNMQVVIQTTFQNMQSSLQNRIDR